eukprot:scaffold7375_cov268-Pinguiococcus_pyrenoidosus.AAC.14
MAFDSAANWLTESMKVSSSGEMQTCWCMSTVIASGMATFEAPSDKRRVCSCCSARASASKSDAPRQLHRHRPSAMDRLWERVCIVIDSATHSYTEGSRRAFCLSRPLLDCSEARKTACSQAARRTSMCRGTCSCQAVEEARRGKSVNRCAELLAERPGGGSVAHQASQEEAHVDPVPSVGRSLPPPDPGRFPAVPIQSRQFRAVHEELVRRNGFLLDVVGKEAHIHGASALVHRSDHRVILSATPATILDAAMGDDLIADIGPAPLPIAHVFGIVRRLVNVVVVGTDALQDLLREAHLPHPALGVAVSRHLRERQHPTQLQIAAHEVSGRRRRCRPGVVRFGLAARWIRPRGRVRPPIVVVRLVRVSQPQPHPVAVQLRPNGLDRLARQGGQQLNGRVTRQRSLVLVVGGHG